MKTILINGEKMTSKKNAFLHLKNKLDQASFYGNNLDALWDVLSSINEPMNIVLFNKSFLDENLGEYGNSIIEVFQEAANIKDNIKFKIVNIRLVN